MEFEISKSELMRGLVMMQGVCGRRLVVPILSQMFIEAKDGKVLVTGSDLEIWVREEMEATVKEEGKATIDAKKSYEIVKEFPEDLPIKVKSSKVEEEFKTRIRCGRSNFNLLGMEPEDFPTIPPQSDRFVKVPTKLFKEMLSKTIFAVSDEVYKLQIAGVYFVKPVDNLMRMVATDAKRLCIVDREAPLELDRGLLIPKKGAMEIKRIINELGEEGMDLGFDKDFGFFKFGKSLVAVRLVESDFIAYEKIIPATDRTITISKSKLMGPLRRISTLVDKSGGIKAIFKKNALELLSSNVEFGDGSDEAEISYDGESFTLGFNVHHVTELLESISEDEILFEIKGQKGPVLIRPVKNAQQICVIMPLKL